MKVIEEGIFQTHHQWPEKVRAPYIQAANIFCGPHGEGELEDEGSVRPAGQALRAGHVGRDGTFYFLRISESVSIFWVVASVM